MSKKQEDTWAFVERVLACPELRVAYLFGPPGLGKTHLAYHAGRTQNGVYPITLTQETPSAELRGHYVPKGDEFVWQDGPFTTAMRNGGRLVLNELSHASQDVLSICYPVLESIETAQLMLPSGETVRPADGFHVIITDNFGPEVLPEALRDRLDARLEVKTPHPAAMERLRPELRKVAERTVALPEERRISMRNWLAVQRLEGALGDLKDACRAVLGEDRAKVVMEAITLAGRP